ncbi:hypothetical protein D6855_01390 [Butyrivibrio sp. CB08]|uniref:hypothetical protein n=1 Tax=Butyrivibrio sp. CB08 TaxID=2364879 RepID=UPI000EA85E8D|nr:hypothetical protein [Butyrivibrio sp. CB08]RKM62104.1 hypothetical protein D6855_01390 [Butyrivibrio sp. CB08]
MKNKVNKQIIKALSVGIAASMALQPVAVYAETTDGVTPTGEPTGDPVVSENNESATTQEFEATETVIEEAGEAVDKAEFTTGQSFNNEGSEEAFVTGEVTEASDLIDDSEDDVKDAQGYAEKRDEELEAFHDTLEDGKFDENISNAKSDYSSAEQTAKDAQEIADKVTEDSTYEEAKQFVSDAEAKYEEANQLLAKAEGERQAAQDTYDAAFKKYMDAQKDASLTTIELTAAEKELADAKKLVEDKEQAVLDAETAANEILNQMLEDDYNKIQEAQMALEDDSLTDKERAAKEDELAKLLIGSYIKANGGKSVKFGTVEKTEVLGIDEEGTDVTNTKIYQTVKYTDKDGKEVPEIFVISVVDGEVCVKSLNVTVEDDLSNKIQDAVEGKAEVPESWKTTDGKEFEETQTTHTFEKKEEGQTGFYAIDTATSPKEQIQGADDVSMKTNYRQGNKYNVTAYVEKADKEPSYELKKIMVHSEEDGYEKKEQPAPISYGKNGWRDFWPDVIRLKNEGYNLKVTYFGEEIDYISLGVAIGTLFNGLAWNEKPLVLSVTNEVDDPLKPIKHEETVVEETISKEYTEVTGWYDSQAYYCDNQYWANYYKNEDIATYEADGAVVVSSTVAQDSHGRWYYVVEAVYPTQNQKTVDKTYAVNRYTPDDYTIHTDHQDAVEAQDARYGTKIVETEGTSLVESDLAQKIAAQEEKIANQRLAAEAAASATEDYYNALDAVEKAREKVENLKKKNSPMTVLAEASAELRAAMQQLKYATWAKSDAKKALSDANDALLLAKEELAKKPVPSTGSDDDDQPSGGDNTTSDDTTPVAGPAIVSNAVVTPTVANDNEAVLGVVRKTSTRSSKKAASTSEAVSTDNGNSNNSEVAGAKKEETKTPVVEETKEIEETETALAAIPELEEKGFAWWWILILAAIAGVSVEEYTRRKKNKAKAENSTKITK